MIQVALEQIRCCNTRNDMPVSVVPPALAQASRVLLKAACGSHTDLMLGPEQSQALVSQNASSRAAFSLRSMERAWGPTVLRLTDNRWAHLQLFFLISSLSLQWTIECHSSVELSDPGIGCQAVNLGTIFMLLLILHFLLVALFTSANITKIQVGTCSSHASGCTIQNLFIYLFILQC